MSQQEEKNNETDWGSSSEDAPRKYVSPIEITKENKWFYLTVIIVLGVTVVITVAGAIVLAWCNKEMPSALIAIGSVAVGALAGLISKNS